MSDQNLDQQNDIANEFEARAKKLDELRTRGVAFPNTFKRDHYSSELHQKFDNLEAEELKEAAHHAKIAGRVMFKRLMGKAAFISIQDGKGRIQAYLAKDLLGEEVYQYFKDYTDLGDIVAIEGEVFKTKTGELSIRASYFQILTKALRPLPDKFHGLEDQEIRYRKRYLDLIMNEESRRTFEIRSKLISGIRNFLTARGFLEVETPMLHTIVGGAAARPFTTHHNALDMDMYLRIAPELYLKRLVVGGFEKVFELNRNFRNEGVSVRHNPEFTMIEWYWAYANVFDNMNLTEELLETLAKDILGTTDVPYGEHVFNFKGPFERLTMIEAICKYAPEITEEQIMDEATCERLLKERGIDREKSWGHGRCISELFEAVAEEHLIQPTFIYSYPLEVSPLARKNDENPFFTDRFEFFIGGREIGNAYSELNDAQDQAQRFQDQLKAKDLGDDEAMDYDEDFVEALEQGLPPTSGEGLGIDRLAMIFSNSPSIRDVILFPAMRHK
ncbi:lysine--tRNA ligase [Psittacicella gerlachiana]|uniref:Lysine--tRNA ligase n=1 Tax=Psittacicella gerlachiana TaxID=2028574 RepID=A0A3A1YR17_9GAMM|nr:lysine--tRNA ligase [Psittacicella gerlachiana]RIY38854.1 lysine--tRNA ligase [Psittacicella gerlachiana]